MVAYYNGLSGVFAEDAWVYVADDAPVLEGKRVIVSLARWRMDFAEILPRVKKVGVLIAPDDLFDAASDRLDALSLVSVSFPKFSDGRGYTQARTLREQFGFKGEIRARGEILSDQIPLMMRCGFDAFEVSHEPTIADLNAGALPGIERTYQSPVTARYGRVRRSRNQSGTTRTSG